MKRLAAAFIAGLFLSVSITAHAMTGNKWLQMSELAQIFYVEGVFDAWSNHDVLELAIEKHTSGNLTVGRYYKLFSECVVGQGMTPKQLHAIVRKYIDENPTTWGFAMPFIVTLAMRETCAKLGYSMGTPGQEIDIPKLQPPAIGQ